MTPTGEPIAGTTPGDTDIDQDTVLRDPGTSDDSPDPDVEAPTAVISAEGD